MSRILVAYVPVLHQGYMQFLQAHSDVEVMYLLGSELLAEFPQMRKDIRALAPSEMREILAFLSLGPKVELLTAENSREVARDASEVVMPDEDIMHGLAEKYFANTTVTYDSVFLRWDSQKSLSHEAIDAHEVISQEQFDQEMMQLAYDQAEKSADWWRQVGAALIKDGKVLLTAHNHHVPGEQQPYYDGDPRSNFHKGEYIELSTAMHAEAAIITEAAKQGMSTEGCTLYATTFPCPVCAKLVAYSGIKKVYFSEGYSMVDGAKLMAENGVEIIKVKMPEVFSKT